MRLYTFQQISPRKITLCLFNVYADGGPYCTARYPVNKADLTSIRAAMAIHGAYEMRDSEV